MSMAASFKHFQQNIFCVQKWFCAFGWTYPFTTFQAKKTYDTCEKCVEEKYIFCLVREYILLKAQLLAFS